MKRAERYAQVKALRDKGMLLREIAEELGLSLSTVHDVLVDPSGEKARERKAKRMKPCEDCGEPHGNSGSEPGPRCRECNGKRERAMTRRWIIDSMREWAEMYGAPPSAADWNPPLCRDTGMEWKIVRHQEAGRPWPAVSSTILAFGSWSAAMAAAGYEPRHAGQYERGPTEQELQEVVDLYRSGLSIAAVAKRVGYCDATVWKWLKRANEPRRPRRGGRVAA